MHQLIHNRRSFMAGSAAACAAGMLGIAREAQAASELETTSVRLPRYIGSGYCWAGLYLAGEILHSDGFTDVRYVQGDTGVDHAEWIARGETDFSLNYMPAHLASLEAGVPITLIGGLHSGCLELIASNDVAGIKELRGRRVGIHTTGSLTYLMVALMAAYVGLDPARDMEWVTEQRSLAEGFLEGRYDAFLGQPPRTQQLRADKIGHTIVNTTVDRPWSQYFCCMISASTDYVRKNPVATKCVLRAIIKAADICAADPSWAAEQLVSRGFVNDYGYALQTLKDTRYDVWRDYDPEASLLFYALRMHETGMIRSDPQAIVESGTDWRFIDELRRELKT